jgi:molybdopterin-guanine dinucleotide biosynthesis protein
VSRAPVPVLRVVGPPGSGKTLLIVSLAEALRSRGHRVVTAAPRRDGATVLVLSNAGRVTLERAMSAARLQAVVPSIDPSVTIILAEAFDAPGDAAFPAVALAPRGTAPRPDVIAHVATENIEATFARLGPGETDGLVHLVEREVLGLPPRDVAAPQAAAAAEPRRGLLRRLFRR